MSASVKKTPTTFFLVTFRDPKDGVVQELKVKTIQDSSLGLSFICLSDFIFHTEGTIVQPTEEQLKKRYENVKSLHLSIYTIISIEELGMDHVGLKFRQDRSNLVSFPGDFKPK